MYLRHTQPANIVTITQLSKTRAIICHFGRKIYVKSECILYTTRQRVTPMRDVDSERLPDFSLVKDRIMRTHRPCLIIDGTARDDVAKMAQAIAYRLGKVVPRADALVCEVIYPYLVNHLIINDIIYQFSQVQGICRSAHLIGHDLQGRMLGRLVRHRQEEVAAVAAI